MSSLARRRIAGEVGARRALPYGGNVMSNAHQWQGGQMLVMPFSIVTDQALKP